MAKQERSTQDASSAPAAAAPSREVDAMFGGNLEADQPAPVIEKERLRAGAVVKHKSTRQVKTRTGMGTVHTFQLLRAPKGTPWFAVWGSANLNSMLRKARPGSTLLLRYRGQERNADGSDGAHLWDVKPSNVSDNQLATYLDAAPRAQAIRELSTVIEQSLAAERDKRNAQRNGGNAGDPFGEAPAYTDDDVPF